LWVSYKKSSAVRGGGDKNDPLPSAEKRGGQSALRRLRKKKKEYAGAPSVEPTKKNNNQLLERGERKNEKELLSISTQKRERKKERDIGGANFVFSISSLQKGEEKGGEWKTDGWAQVGGGGKKGRGGRPSFLLSH